MGALLILAMVPARFVLFPFLLVLVLPLSSVVVLVFVLVFFRCGRVDAACHVEFAGSIDITADKLPAMAVLSPSKQRYHMHVGKFQVAELESTLEAVLTGKKRTGPYSRYGWAGGRGTRARDTASRRKGELGEQHSRRRREGWRMRRDEELGLDAGGRGNWEV